MAETLFDLPSDAFNPNTLALYFPYLATERLIRQGLVTTTKFVLVREQNQTLYVGAASRDALQDNPNISIGMSLSDLRASQPDIIIYHEDLEVDRAFLKGLMRWAVRYSPKLTTDGEEGLILDIAGVSHLFGGVEKMLADIHGRLSRTGLTVKMALAENKVAATALARYSRSDYFIQNCDIFQLVSGLPFEALQPTNQEQLLARQLGLKTVGALAALPRQQVAARFNQETVERLAMMLGERASPLKFARHKKAWKEALVFPEPIANTPYIIDALDSLLVQLLERLKIDDKGVRSLALMITRVDHEHMTKCITLVRPTLNHKVIMELLLPFFDQMDVGFGIEEMFLEATSVETIASKQATLVQQQVSVRSDDQLVNRLSNLLGAEHVMRISPADSHLPAKEMNIQPALYSYEGDKWQVPPHRRPLLLYQTPINVAQKTEQLPQNIRWQGQNISILFLSDAERICGEWWLDDPQWRDGVRDYYWIATSSGALLWIYCTSAGWFVHGLG